MKTVDEVMGMLPEYGNEYVCGAGFAMEANIRAELEKWQAEIKELQEKLQDSMWDTENERLNRELVELENERLKAKKGE
jgi:hypothetical protein